MKDFSKHDLISAYLDGEVTPAERAEVEQLLATHPEARQLLEEFRALGSALQNLPPHVLGENLTGSVLQKAERQMLAEPAKINAAGAEPSGEEPLWRMVSRRALTPRSLAWSGLAVAVALLLMVTQSRDIDRPAGDQVALVQEEAEPKAAPEIRAARSEEKRDLAKLEETAAREAPAAAPSLAAPAKEPGSPPPSTFAAKQAPPMRKPLGKTAPAQPRSDRPVDEAGELAESAGSASGKAANAKASGAPRLATKNGPPKGAAGRTIHDRLRFDNKQRAATPNEVLFVYCDISAEAARENSFEQVLADQGIAWAEKTEAENEVLRRGLDDAYDFRRKSGMQFGVGRHRGEEGKPAPLDLVYVEAPPEQIQAMLSALKANPKVFPSVNTSTKRIGVSLEEHLSQREQDRSTARGAGPGEPARGAMVQEEMPKPKDKTPEAEMPRQKAQFQQQAEPEKQEITMPRGRAIRLQHPASGPADPSGGEAGQAKSSMSSSSGATQTGQQALEPPSHARALFVFRVVDTPTSSASSSLAEPAKSATENEKPSATKPE